MKHCTFNYLVFCTARRDNRYACSINRPIMSVHLHFKTIIGKIWGIILNQYTTIRDTLFSKVLKFHLPDLCNHSLEHLKDFSSWKEIDLEINFFGKRNLLLLELEPRTYCMAGWNVNHYTRTDQTYLKEIFVIWISV